MTPFESNQTRSRVNDRLSTNTAPAINLFAIPLIPTSKEAGTDTRVTRRELVAEAILP
jgi:hypothetical protein